MRKILIKFILPALLTVSFSAGVTFTQPRIEKWEIFELKISGTEKGNPYTDINLSATFINQRDTFLADGFYDGNGIYKIRFMPGKTGEWKYLTHSNNRKLANVTGSFICIDEGAGNNGPVGVKNTFHFEYANGKPFLPVGTTCYAWVHQSESLQVQTLKTLEGSPFNKIRMTVLPKYYSFNRTEPQLYPYEKDNKGNWDFTRFNPEFFRNIENRIQNLKELGIEADLILFHPYDEGHWGFDRMGQKANHLYLEYVISRFAAYRNVWWSMANEYDLMKNMSMDDWEDLFLIIMDKDPYGKLASIHNGELDRFYDYSKPYITHVSLQHPNLWMAPEWLRYNKPVINDECEYEGNLWFPWGNLTSEEFVHRAWLGYVYGIYVSHGETYSDNSEYIWWSHGGSLKGESPERLAFLKKIMYETSPDGLGEFDPGSWLWNRFPGGKSKNAYIYYFGDRQPANWLFYQGEAGVEYRAEVIDTWNMTISEVEGKFTKGGSIPLPQRPRLALRVWKLE
jgi:hypothetical protein